MILVNSIDNLLIIGLEFAFLKLCCQNLMTVFNRMYKFLIDSFNMLNIRLVAIDPPIDALRKLGEGNA